MFLPKLRTTALMLALSLRVVAAPPDAPAAGQTAPAAAQAAPATTAAPATPAVAPAALDSAAVDAGTDSALAGSQLDLTAIPPPAAEPGEDPIPLAGLLVPAIHTPSAPEAWGGMQTVGAEVLSQRVASYDLHAVLDPKAHTVEGREVLRWTNRSAVPVRSIYFHLYLNAFEGPHSTWMTEKAALGAFRSGVEIKKGEWGWIDVAEVMQAGKPAQLSFAHPDNGPETDRSVLRAVLPEAVAPGATVELSIKFHDQLPRVIARTGYFDSYHLVGQWFPKIGVLELPGERGATAPRWNVHEFHLNTEFYADFGSYDLEVTAPKGFIVAATGERVGQPRETEGGVVHKFHQDDIHDAVFCAYDKFSAPLSGSYDGPGSPHVTVETYFPEEFRKNAEDSQKATLDSLKFFSETLGPYPYRHVTVIVPPFNAGESGGMEYETFFTSEGGTGIASGLVRFVAVHEFGHGYFMGLLATNEFEEPFLDEGMNEFWDNRLLDGEAVSFNLGLLGRLGFGAPAFSQWDQERIARGPSPFAPDPLVATSWDRYSEGSYVSIYPKTALIFHDLESLLGTETFARGMKLYYQRWHHRHPSTADLMAALLDGCEKLEDRELVQRFFDDLVYGARAVDDLITEVSAEEILPEPGTQPQDGGHVEFDEEAIGKQIEAARKAFAEAADAGAKESPAAQGASANDASAGGKDGGVEEAGAGEGPDGKKFHPGPFPFRSQVKARRRGMQLPDTLVVKFEDGSSKTISWPPGEAWHKWTFEGPARVEWAQLDPDRTRLTDVNKLDDGRTREAKSLAGRRWTLEIATWMELLFSLVGGL